MSTGLSDNEYFGRNLSLGDIENLVSAYAKSNQFESLVAGRVGIIPNLGELARYADGPSSITLQGQVLWQDGSLTIKLSSESEVAAQELPELKVLIEPSLSIIDEDYRRRSHLPASKASKCDLLFSYGRVDKEKAEHIDGSPHLDGSLDSPDLYYVAAVGPTTRFYEGKYSGESMQLLSNFDLLDGQIKAQQAQFHSPKSGEIVLSTFCTVHSSPGVSLLGQPRVFIKAYYRPLPKMEVLPSQQ